MFLQDIIFHFFSLGSSKKHLHKSVPFFFVDLVSKPYSVHDGQLEVDVALLQIICLRAQLYLALVVADFLIFKCRIEKSVH